jgi:CHAD domain-containing protein
MAKADDINGLDCAGDAVAGIALVLRTRLAEMCALRAAALDWSDPEGVHDMRVASRRLRSAMRDFAPYLRGRVPGKRLRQLADALGAVRDADVALIALAELNREVEPDIDAGLRLLITERCQQREHARALLELALEESALAALQEKFLRRLARSRRKPAGRARHQDRNDARSFRSAGREIVLARLAELFTGGKALYYPHAERRLHRLRIAAKRLRYALELFAPCWGEQLTTAAGEVAELQKSLGELHDCDIWIAELGARLEKQPVHAEDEQPELNENVTRMRRATVWLLERFVKERGKHYRAALARWEDWIATGFCQHLRTSFDNTDFADQPAIVPTDSPSANQDES